MSDTTDVKSEGKEVSTFSRPTDEQLAQLDSIAAVRDLIGPSAVRASDLGSGFALLKDGDALVNRPCLFLFWEFHEGDFSDDFVSAHIVTFDTNGVITGKYVYNDGSTGVRDQLKALGPDARNLVAESGLRKSSYKYCEQCESVVKDKDLDAHKGHKVIPAATYYIDTSVSA